MPVEGLQTHDFIQRLERSRSVLPSPIINLAEILQKLIDEIEYPTPADISRMHERMRAASGTQEDLDIVCGGEGKLCVICPFAAYIPSEFPHASREIPVCIPWIAMSRGSS
jgi:hypothetical protein